VLCSLFLFAFFSNRRGRAFYKKLLLKLPLINKMTQQAVLTRFCRALSVMLKSSVSLVEGLSLAKRTMNHPSFEAVIDHAKAEIMQGGRLSVNLSKSPLIPSLVVRMVSISEETGNMSEMFQNIALIYEEELEKSLTRFTAMLQPVMLLFLAIVVGVVILSVLLPLTDVGSFLNT
jgi:general secretion pathway protein F/type IV pilus assembly protein PilC